MIYTPRDSVDMLTYQMRHSEHKSVCTKIEFKGFEISIVMDSSYGCGNLTRTDIRIFDLVDSRDVTDLFFDGGEYMLYGNAETLLRVMKKIDEMEDKK